MNQIQIIGRLTSDPELRHTNNNLAFCKFTVAVNRPFDRDKADFINCVAWKTTAENLVKYMRKGNLVGVVGSIQTGSYSNKDGNRVYTTEIIVNQVIFLDSKKERGTTEYQAEQAKSPADFMPKEEKNELKYDISNDDLPF